MALTPPRGLRRLARRGAAASRACRPHADTDATSRASAIIRATSFSLRRWSIRKSGSGQRIYDHSGGSVGGTCQLIVYPDSHVVVALLTNLGEALWKIADVEAIGEPFAGK